MIREAASDRLGKALDLAKSFVEVQQDAVVAVLNCPGDPVFVAFDYWERPGRFESMVAFHAVEADATGGTLICPIIARKGDFTQARHVDGLPADDDEDQLLWIFAFDIDEGFDVGRCVYAKTSSGVVFAEPEVLTGKASLTDDSPGYALMRSLLTTDSD